MMIDGDTKVVGLFGYPVSHSASPEMHNAAFRALGLNFIYIPLEVKPSDLGKAIKALPYLGIKGVNLTIPHKVKVIKYLDWLSPEARMTQSVNTVMVKGRKLYGFTTDIQGFREDFERRGSFNLGGKEVFLLGAGGAARAVAIALAQAGAAKINIANRTPMKARQILKIIKAKFPAIKTGFIPWDGLAEAALRSRVIINATSLGMKSEDHSPIKPSWLDKGKIVYDLVYTPSPTKLLKIARDRGCRAIDGLGMLASQGAMSFYLWTGKKAPLGVMIRVLQDKFRVKCRK